jgi:HEAT repeat protein
MDLPNLLLELSSGDDERAETAAQALAALGAAALPALSNLLSDPDEDTRWWALRALAECSTPGVAAALRTALDDPSPAVRQAALLGLRLHPEAESIPALIARLYDSDSLCAGMAADALVAIGAEAVPALIEVLQGTPSITPPLTTTSVLGGARSFPAQVESARALAEIGDPSAIPALFAAGNEGSTLLDYWVSIGLENMGVGSVYFKP